MAAESSGKPLGWLLPKAAQDEIACQLLHPHNLEQFHELLASLGRSDFAGDSGARSAKERLDQHVRKLGVDC